MDLTALSLTGTWIVNNAPDLVGFVIPLLIELLNKEVNDEKSRFVVTLLACFAAAMVLKWQELSVGSVEAVLTSAGIIFLQAQLVFKLYFKSSVLRDKIQQRLTGEQLVIPERVKGN